MDRAAGSCRGAPSAAASSSRHAPLGGIFSNHEGTHGRRTDLEGVGLEAVRTAVWLKAGAARQLTGDRPACGHEVVIAVFNQHHRKAD